jgi:hypothetical protein
MNLNTISLPNKAKPIKQGIVLERSPTPWVLPIVKDMMTIIMNLNICKGMFSVDGCHVNIYISSTRYSLHLGRAPISPLGLTITHRSQGLRRERSYTYSLRVGGLL